MEVKDLDQDKVKKYRETWEEIAKENGWYSEPFGLQFFVNSEGKIIDAVSFRGLQKDIVTFTEDL